MEGIRGYEYYTSSIGVTGLFREETIPTETRKTYEINATDIPDVYKLEGELGYLRVRTIELSRELRLLGSTFRLHCVKNPENDGTWTPIIESRGNTNTNEQHRNV